MNLFIRPLYSWLRRSSDGLFLLSASVLAVFLFAQTFVEARMFIVAQTGALLSEAPWVPFAIVAALGLFVLKNARPSPTIRWITRAYCALAVAGTLHVALAREPLYGILAFGLLIPAWARLPGWTREVLEPRVQRVGPIRMWLNAAGLLALALAITLMIQGLYVVVRYPFMDFGVFEASAIAARIAIYAVGTVAAVVLVFVVARVLVGREGRAVALVGVFAALALTAIVAFLIVNVSRAVAPTWLSPPTLAFALAVAAPSGVFIARNLVQSGAPDVASAIIGYGTLTFPPASAPPPARARARWLLGRRAAPRVALVIVVIAGIGAVQWVVGGWHMRYAWGSGTTLIYNAIAVATVVYLLTILSRRLQERAMLAGAALIAPMAAWGAVNPVAQETWNTYVNFDRGLRLSRALYNGLSPDRRPEVARLREAIEASASYRGADLTARFAPRAVVSGAPGRRPDVLLIVVDSMRLDSFDARYPGDRRALAFLGQRFVSYTSAWTSYNATAGSLPALFGGALQPAWYRTGAGADVRYGNAIEDGLRLAGYSILNAATYSDFARYWSDRAETFVPSGGRGLGDPGYILPRVAERIGALRSAKERSPFFIYTHIFNLHQPLLWREGVPRPADDKNWMRALYEHNVSYLDASLDAFFQELDGAGALDDTLVVITADHGEELFDFGGLYHGWQLNPYELNVPLYVHYPRGAGSVGAPSPGALVEAPVNLIDVAPTILSIAGAAVERESAIQGVDLRGVAASPPRDFVALSWESCEAGVIRALPSPRLEVVDAGSGRVEAYTLRGRRWHGARPERSAEELSGALSGMVNDIYSAWSKEPDRRLGAQAPAPSDAF